MALLLKHLIIPLKVVNILLVWNPPPADSNGDLILPHTRREVYAQPGDINIGVILDLHDETDESGCAGDIHPGSWAIEYPESVAFAVDLVNKNPNLMHKAKLGFYMLDDCDDRRQVLAHALKFMPQNELVCKPDPCNSTVSPNITCIPTTCTITSSSNLSSLSSTYKEEPVPHYDVVGVLAPQKSTLAIPMSLLLSLAKMPIVGYMTSSEELSDESLHPTFLKVVTSDRHQAHAMLEFISANGWSYISVVYSHGLYGESAFAFIKSSAGSYNICIATAHRVKDEDDMTPVVINLLHYPRARVVILFTNKKPALNLLETTEKLNETGRFIWICCDAVTNAGRATLSRYIENVVGAFMFVYNTVQVPEFHEYLRRQNVMTSLNPWFKLAWENTFKCSFLMGTCNSADDITKNVHFGFEGPPSLLMDAVLTFAYGIHDLLVDLCPGTTGHNARNCITRDSLLDYLLNVSFDGYTGHIQFDKNREYHGKFIIYQMAYDYLEMPDKHGKPTKTNMKGLVGKKVAYFDSLSDILSYTSENISWDHLLKAERIVPLTVNTTDPEVPESVCSRPCFPSEYKIQKTLACCWECSKCRSNEKLIREKARCEACKKFTWPDPETDFTSCRDIPISYIISTEAVPLIEVCLAVSGIIGAFLVAAAYFHHRETRVIKGASRELSAMQITGILMGYIAVILFQTTPTPTMCGTLYFMFCLSFAWLYSPLLIKAIRIYRIFQSGKKCRRPRFISPLSQVIMASVIILSQVILCLVTYFVFNPTAIKSQPVLTEHFVELSCDMTLPGLVSFLAFNLVFVCLSAVFAFKTRKLPSNFRESKFISMCVYTTLVIWLAFIPTYFTATRDYVQVMLLSGALLLNHTVALLFLFVPKIYAIMYVPEGSFSTVTDKTQTVRAERDSSAWRTSDIFSLESLPDENEIINRFRGSKSWTEKVPRAFQSLKRVKTKSAADVKTTNSMFAPQKLYEAFLRVPSSFTNTVTGRKQSARRQAEQPFPASDLETEL